MPDQYLSRAASIALRHWPIPNLNDYSKAMTYTREDFISASRYLCRESLHEIARLIVAAGIVPKDGLANNDNYAADIHAARDVLKTPKKRAHKDLVVAIANMCGTVAYNQSVRRNYKCLNEVAARIGHKRRVAAKVSAAKKQQNSKSRPIAAYLNAPSTYFENFPFQRGAPCYVTSQYRRPDGACVIYMHLAKIGKIYCDSWKSTDWMARITIVPVQRHVGLGDTFEAWWHPAEGTWYAQFKRPVWTTRSAKALPGGSDGLFVSDTTPFQTLTGEWHVGPNMHVIPVTRMLQLQAARGDDGILSATNGSAKLSLANQCLTTLEKHLMTGADIPSHLFEAYLPSELWVIDAQPRNAQRTDLTTSYEATLESPWGLSPWVFQNFSYIHDVIDVSNLVI